MQIDDIISECVARKKLAPGKTPVQLVSEVMNEMDAYRAVLRERPEFNPKVFAADDTAGAGKL